MTYQALHDKELLADIQDIVTMQSITRNMRENLKLALQRSKPNMEKTFKQRAAIIWNTLPQSMKTIPPSKNISQNTVGLQIWSHVITRQSLKAKTWTLSIIFSIIYLFCKFHSFFR